MIRTMATWMLAVGLVASMVACSSGGGSETENDVIAEDSTEDLGNQDQTEDDSLVEDVAGDLESDTGTQWTDFDPTTAAALQALLDEHVLFSADPGVTLSILTDDGRRWAGASGTATLQTDMAMETDTGFRVGSNTKPYTAVVILQLVEEGLVGLDDDITDYFPEYPQWAGITVRLLLNMRAGIVDYLTSAAFMLGTIQNPDQEMAPEDVLAYIAEEPLQFTPGEDGQYNNSSYMLLGMIIEQVTGNTVEDEIRTRLIEPLGLEHTFLDVTGEARDYVAHGYMDLNLVGILFGVPPSVLAFIPQENIYQGSIVDCSYLFHPSITWAAGALISSALDMSLFMRSVLKGDVLKPETLAEMQTTDEISLLGGRIQYGLGLQVRATDFGDVMGHGGLNFGYQAGTYYSAAAQATFSHMHNYLPEQSDSLQNGMLDILINGVDEVPAICTPVEGFFDLADGPYVQARFKGDVNALGEETPVGGVNEWNFYDGDVTTPLYGYGSHAILQMSGLQTRLVMNSYAPANVEDFQIRATAISIDRSLFDSLDATGVYELSMSNPGAVFITISELQTDENGDPTKLCFTGVNDFTRTSTIQVCNSGEFSPEPGAELKFFANIAIETDPVKVEQTLATLSIPLCLCMGEDGNWGACTD